MMFACKKFVGKLQELYTTEIIGGEIGLVYAYFMALISFFLFLLYNLAYKGENKSQVYWLTRMIGSQQNALIVALPSPISCRFFFLAELRQTCNSLLSIPCNHYIQSLFSCLAERASDFRLSWIPSTRQSSKSLIAVNVPACLCTLRGVLSDGFLTILLRSGNSVLLCNACGDLYGERDGFLWPPALCGNVPRKGLKMFHITNGSGDSLFLKNSCNFKSPS